VMGGKAAMEQQMASGMSKGEFTIKMLTQKSLVIAEGDNTTKCER
jgi:hypothetical protein